MARADDIRATYESAAERLFTDREAFAEYLAFSGRFYKLPSAQTITLHDDNPNAEMVTDYDTWKRFGRQVKRGGWSTAVLAGGEIKYLFDISQTVGKDTPYQWKLDRETAEEFVKRFSEEENRTFSGMTACINSLTAGAVRERIDEIASSLDISETDKTRFERSFLSMVRRVAAARCEWKSTFRYGGGALDLSALDLINNTDEAEALLEQVQITAKNVLLSMERTIDNINYERGLKNGKSERSIGRGSAQGMVRRGEEILSGNNDAREQNVQTGRGDVHIPSDNGAAADGRGAGTDEEPDKPFRQSVEGVYDGELSTGYPEAAGQNVVGADTAEDRSRGSEAERGDESEFRKNEPNSDGRGGTAQMVGEADDAPTRANLRNVGERSEDGSVTSDNKENTLTAEDSSAVNYLSLKIAELSDKFVKKYDGEYREFTLANYAFNYSLTHTGSEYALPEYDLNLSVRDNVEKMLRSGYRSYLKDYLNAIFKEAFEGRIIVDEGIAAGELMSRLAKLDKNRHTIKRDIQVDISNEPEQMRLFPEPLAKKQQAELEKLTADLTDEFVRWEKQFLDGGSDAYYEDGVGLSLIRNHIIYDKHELEEKFPDNLPEIYHRETPPEYPNNYQSVKKGDTLRFEYGDFLVLNIEKTNEYTGEYSVQLQDDKGEVIIQNLRDIKTKFRNLTNRGEVPSRADVPDITNIPSDLDKIYVDKDSETVRMVYYNPDSTAGGQLVYNEFDFDDIFAALGQNDPMDFILSSCKQTAIDVDMPGFDAAVREFFADNEDFNSRDDHYLDKLFALPEPTYSILQLKDGADTRDYRFAGMAELRERGLYVDRENYSRVYRGRLKGEQTLEDIYTKFNVDRPSDFYGHSLSTGDVIGIVRDGKPTAYYIDSVGFEEIPDFLLSREERKARRTLTDNLVLIAENQLASDEMDTLGDKLFDYDNERHYSGSGTDWLIGNGMTADEFETVTTLYHNGEDVRAELAKGMYTDYGKLGGIEFFDDKDGIGYVNIETSHDESGMTFKTKGGFEITYSWEQLGDAMITAARKEYDRHEALDRAYREDGEKYGNLYLALRDGRTIYLNRADDSDKKHTNYRLESGEEHTIIGSGAKYHSTLFVADDENGERVQLNDFGSGNYYNIIHTLLENGVRGRYEVSLIEREPVFKVEKDDTLDSEAVLKSYIKSNGDLLPGEILYSGSTKNCKKYAEWLRLGGNSQAEIKGMYRAKLDEERAASENVSQGDLSRLVKNEDTIFDWSKYAALGAHSAFDRIIREKNIAIDTSAKISLPPKAEDLSDYVLEIGIKPCTQNNELYFAIEYNLRNEKTEKITEVGAYFIDTDDVMIAGHSGHLPDYETFRAMVEADAAKAVDKIRELLKQESEQSITITDVSSEKGDIPYNEKKVITATIVGDFYEFYGETAKELSEKFNLTMVDRDGKPMVGVPAYSFDDFCGELYDKGYIVENWRHYQEVIKPQVEENPSLVRAETLINEFCEREYNSEGDFTNRLRVGLAYTDDEETGYPIEVYADLEYNRIMTEFNKVLVSEEQYKSLDEMCDLALEHLDFDDLVYLPEEQRIKGISKTMDDADRKDADILDNYGLLPEKEPTVTLMSDDSEIPDNRVERGEDNFSVSQKYIFDNERSPAAIKDFALSTGAVASDISTKSLRNGLYGVRVETWESRADEIKDFAAAYNAVETHEWGVHQVVTFDYVSGTDEKYDYRSLSEAVEAANGYVKGTKQETYGEFVKYDGAAVLNKENLKIEHTVGEIDVRSIFSEEVLKANGIEIPNNKMKTAVGEKTVEKENVQREQTNENEGQRIKGISKTMDDAESQEPKYTVEQTSDAFEEPFIIRNNDVSEDSPDRYYDIDGIYQTFETEKAAQEYADKLNLTVEPTLEIVSPVTQLSGNVISDYRIEETEPTSFGPKARYAANIAAIKTLNRIESENRIAAPDEQEILAQYVGWGGIPQAFDSDNSAWAAEYNELKELLTPDEYEAARSTVLTAHYTSPTVISAIYKALGNFGFKGGNVLEPAMGIGNFFGVMPEEMRSQSQMHGVELDEISGRIAKQLYPNAEIQICGYENTAFSDNFFDAAVGNVPFGNYSVSDTRYNRENFLIHDYFFAKTLDKVAPGGVVAFITSKGTLDKATPKVREYLAKRADLIGAIRLPNSAFKANAGTEVTADIIFLQKREKMSVEKPDWCYTAEITEGISINQYFADHPEMILGKMQLVSGRYGEETACVPTEGADLEQQLDRAVRTLKRDIIVSRREKKRAEEHGTIPATADVRNFTYTEIDGKIYFRENNIMTEVELKGRDAARVRGLIGVRNAFYELVDAQRDACSDEALSQLQSKLNTRYDAFVKSFGFIGDIKNRNVFGADDSCNALCGGLETEDPETHETVKTDIFTKRTIKPFVEVTHTDTPLEALYVSLDMRGFVDIDYMSELCGISGEKIANELWENGFIFKNPETEKYEEAAEYLSGYVRDKLKAAQKAAEESPEYERNVAALEKVQPEKLGAGDISVRIGVPWVTIEDYCEFFCEYAQGNIKPHSFFGNDTVLYRSISGEYKITNKGGDNNRSVAATSSFGTARMNSLEIFENLLNNRDMTVRDAVPLPDGKTKYVLNKKETQLAQEKARQMKEAFPKWLWEKQERREKYVGIYNELFNSLVGREYDGSHQTFPGMNPFIELNEHQKNAVMRCKLGGNTLLAHCVGAGKTFEMAAAVMEKRRLGLINKACIVVPKHLVGQTSAEWLRLYPQANILTASEKDFDKNHRQKFIGRCCTGDYDAVIISYQQFQKIPMSVEYQRDFLMKQIDEITGKIGDFNNTSRAFYADEKRSVKDLEMMKKRLSTRLQKLLDTPRDTSLSFEQLGFDCIVADEAHNYKNGLVVTKMKNVSGIGSKAAKKCEDFLMKTDYLNEKFGERNLILASGTPISNSMTELYIMQKYMRPSALQKQGLQNFDDWASTFGEVVTQLELKPAGDGFRMKKRFAKFVNLAELMQAYKDFADIRTAEMLNLPVPEIEGGKPQVISAKPDDFQKAYMQILAERSEAIHNGSVDPTEDNMLKITGEARLLGLDARCLNPEADNSPTSKVNLLVDKVMEIYEETTEQKGVQAIFCDIAINGGAKPTDEIEVSEDGEVLENTELNAEQQGEILAASKFSVYDYIKAELIRRGIPENEICFAGDAKNQGQRGELYAQLREGTKRIVLASTSKMGTGANIQTRLCALHNLDIPWKPSDFEQRLGRIVRQGNSFPTVKIFNYVTEGTFDAYMLNLIVTKQKFISQLMSGKTPARTCEDVDEMVLNYSEMQAIASGDPRIKEKIQLDTDVSRLRLLESEHLNKRYRLEDRVTFCQAQISIVKKQLDLAKADKSFAEKNALPDGEFKIVINGKTFTERKDAGAELRKAQMRFLSTKKSEEMGEYCGFKMSLNWGLVSDNQHTVTISLTPKIGKGLSYSAQLELQNDLGNITRLENILKLGIDRQIDNLKYNLARNEKDLSEAERTKDVPFEFADELAEKSARLAILNVELGVDKKDETIFDDECQGDNDNRGKGRDDGVSKQNKKPKRPKH